MALRSFIAGCAGGQLTPQERSFFAEAKPVGLILFQRNCFDKEQIKRLVHSFQEAVGSKDVLVLIDQEGGRVARLKPPIWREFPAAAKLGKLYRHDQAKALEATQLIMRLLAHELYELGINVDCLPVLDSPIKGADNIIGDRAYSQASDEIIALAGRAIVGLLEGGVAPVAKHVPGHGRAMVDSHKALPVVDAPRHELEARDFVPFAALNHVPFAMTAHIVMTTIDEDHTASASKKVINEIIRGHIGFDGVLMCDDLSMKALKGPMTVRASQVLSAGCDLVLHCNGNLKEMKEVASVTPEISGRTADRMEKAQAAIKAPRDFDLDKADWWRRQILALDA